MTSGEWSKIQQVVRPDRINITLPGSPLPVETVIQPTQYSAGNSALIERRVPAEQAWSRTWIQS